MKEFYVVLGERKGWRKWLWGRWFVGAMVAGGAFEAAKKRAIEKCRKVGGTAFVFKCVGYAHIPPRRVVWRKTRAQIKVRGLRVVGNKRSRRSH